MLVMDLRNLYLVLFTSYPELQNTQLKCKVCCKFCAIHEIDLFLTPISPMFWPFWAQVVSDVRIDSSLCFLLQTCQNLFLFVRAEPRVSIRVPTTYLININQNACPPWCGFPPVLWRLTSQMKTPSALPRTSGDKYCRITLDCFL